MPCFRKARKDSYTVNRDLINPPEPVTSVYINHSSTEPGNSSGSANKPDEYITSDNSQDDGILEHNEDLTNPNDGDKTEDTNEHDDEDNDKPDDTVKVEILTPPIEPNNEQATVRRPSMIPNKQKEEIHLKTYEKNEHDYNVIKTAISENDFLSQIITGEKMFNIINAMYKQDINGGQTIMTMGQKGDKIYVLNKGQLHFKGKNFDFLEDKQKVFGELAILYKAGRQATIRATKDSEVWVLDSGVYQQIIKQTNRDEHIERVEFLLKVEALNKIDKNLLEQGADFLEKEFFESDTQIIKEGDRGDKFYIIRAGTVTITKNKVGEIGQLDKGKSFGELALKGEDCRQATITANAPGVECLTLTKEHFDMYFSDVQITKIDPAELHIRFKELHLTDLKINGTLGIGKFGRVELVSLVKDRKKTFALKYIQKKMIVDQNLEQYVINEKELQIPCKSLFIVESYRTFKDSKYVYFLMEVCVGGDLFGLLYRQKEKSFNDKDAKFISGCILEALSYLHSRGIIFRDLKPENLMIDKKGYIKLTDFGFAKSIVNRGKTYTVVGTPEYVAPEVITEKGHDKGVDYWAFGIIVYELLTGKTPFRASDEMKTLNKILEGVIKFNTNLIDSKARSLIEKLLKPISKDRLGMQKRGCEDIRKHVWFNNFKWEQLQSGKMSSSFKPKSTNPLDYVEKFHLDTDIPDDDFTGWDETF